MINDKPGYKVLTSQTYDSDDPHITTDVQFGVTEALMGAFVRHEEAHPSAPDAGTPWYSLDHTYVWSPAQPCFQSPRSNSPRVSPAAPQETGGCSPPPRHLRRWRRRPA
jgi:hypothetical protein